MSCVKSINSVLFGEKKIYSCDCCPYQNYVTKHRQLLKNNVNQNEKSYGRMLFFINNTTSGICNIQFVDK